MSLIQLIYACTPFGFDSPTLNQILSAARRNNARDQITGALICRADLYLQMLEGPRPAVTAAFDRILRDAPARSWMCGRCLYGCCGMPSGNPDFMVGG